MQKIKNHAETEKERIKKDKERIEKIKKQNLKNRNARKSSPKASKWKTLLISTLTLATTHFAKAQQEYNTQDQNTFKTEQNAPRPKAHDNSSDVYNLTSTDSTVNTVNAQKPVGDTGLRAAAAELAMDVDFMSNFLIEEGENTLGNFNLQDITLTEDMADGIEAGKSSSTLNKYALTTNIGNSDGKHCYRGTKNILNKYGISLSGNHAYEAIGQLRNIPEFTEIKCSYEMLKYLPGGTVVVQDKGTTASGHIFVIGEQSGRKVQKCGRTYELPTSNRRGSSGQHYGGLCVFVPSDCKLSLDLTAELYAKGCFNTPPEEFLLPILEKDPSFIQDAAAPSITKGNVTEQDGKETSYVSPELSKNEKKADTFDQSVLRYKQNRSYNA